MSEFKFACPVCGQHIQCDSAHAGVEMDCPTCFQKITVPQAPAGGEQKFILTGSKVSPKTVYAGRPPSVIPLKRFPGGLVVALILIFMGTAAAAVYWLTVIHPRHAATPASQTAPSGDPAEGGSSSEPAAPTLAAPRASDASWRLELDASPIPDTPAAGRIHGQDFLAEQAVIQNGSLTLRTGNHRAVEFGVTIHLSGAAPEALSGRTITVTAQSVRPAPVTLHWPDGGQQSRDYNDGYAMRLEFGALARNRLPGKIYLCLPDDEKSYVLGAFKAIVSRAKPKK
jgi:hypothetical protein